MIAQPLTTLSDPSPLDMPVWLTIQAMREPAFELADALYFFDPVALEVEDVHNFEYEFVAPHVAAMDCARTHLPDEYIQFSEAYFKMPTQHFATHVQREMLSKHMIGDNIWWDENSCYQYIPHSYYGVDVFSHLFDETYGHLFESPELESLLEAWGKDDNEDLANYAVRHAACSLIIESLEQHTETTKNSIFDNVAMFIRWVWAMTNNSSMDLSEEDFYEMGYEHLCWNELISAWDIQYEAEEMLAMSSLGIQILEQDPILLNALIANYNTIYKIIFADYQPKEISDNGYYDNIPIQWATDTCLEADAGLTTAQSQYRNLRFWRDDAYTDSVHRR